MDIKTLIGSTMRPDGAASGTKPRGTPDAGERPAAQAGAQPSESVTLTQAARSMKAAQESAGAVPFDDAKVAEIKAAISEGRYPIDNERLADRMLSYERLLA